MTNCVHNNQLNEKILFCLVFYRFEEEFLKTMTAFSQTWVWKDIFNKPVYSGVKVLKVQKGGVLKVGGM